MKKIVMRHLIKLIEKLFFNAYVYNGYPRIKIRKWALYLMLRSEWFWETVQYILKKIIDNDRKKMIALYRRHCHPYREGIMWEVIMDKNLEILKQEYAEMLNASSERTLKQMERWEEFERLKGKER